MTDWKRGGWTGSLNRWVRREIREHFRDNASARGARYPLVTRYLHEIFDDGSLWKFLKRYFLVLLVVVIMEVVLTRYVHHWLPPWTGGDSVKALLTNVTSYLLSTQVGVLGVLSIAVGLVTLISQRENTSTDVQVYYHESLAFGVVASSIALLMVLCVQLLWPVNFGVHRLGYGTGLHTFKLVLTIIHISWLLLNLFGLAHFVATTLAFVQQSAREKMRERYTANVVLPIEMRGRLRTQLYLGAGPGMVEDFWPRAAGGGRKPTIWLGQDFGRSGESEMVLDPRKGVVLLDVRMRWVRWVVRRWLNRCRTTSPRERRIGGLPAELLLVFPPRLDQPIEDGAGLCRRRGGVRLTLFERFLLQRAFKFGRARNGA